MSARQFLALLWILGALACASGPPAPTPAPPVASESSLTRTLADQGEKALEAGDLDTAQRRFERALEAESHSVLALTGLGKTAAARAATTEAIDYFERALTLAPQDAEARLGLARAFRSAGETLAARLQLEAALQEGNPAPVFQFELAALTGPAPKGRPADLAEALRVANAHPLDPRALVNAGDWASRAGKQRAALHLFETALWLTHLDPDAGGNAFARLQAMDPAWRERRLVLVHCWADETVRSDPAWRFRLLRLFQNLSLDAAPMIDTLFVPVSMSPFTTAGTYPSLAAMEAQLSAQVRTPPARGIIAGFTERPPPPRGSRRLGQAEFLGRRMFLRLETEELRSHVLAHEMLHLYGGIHVSPEFESIMNPAGDSYSLDPLNTAIFRAMRNRRFERGGIEENVLPWIDTEETARAYAHGLQVNLGFRRVGMLEAKNELQESRFLAAARAQEARQLDDHLGDVARFLSHLRWREEKKSTSVQLLELSAKLYGIDSSKGRAAMRDAERLRPFVGDE